MPTPSVFQFNGWKIEGQTPCTHSCWCGLVTMSHTFFHSFTAILLSALFKPFDLQVQNTYLLVLSSKDLQERGSVFQRMHVQQI